MTQQNFKSKSIRLAAVQDFWVSDFYLNIIPTFFATMWTYDIVYAAHRQMDCAFGYRNGYVIWEAAPETCTDSWFLFRTFSYTIQSY